MVRIGLGIATMSALVLVASADGINQVSTTPVRATNSGLTYDTTATSISTNYGNFQPDVSGNCGSINQCFLYEYFVKDSVDASANPNGGVGWNFNLNTGPLKGGWETIQSTINVQGSTQDTDKNYVGFQSNGQAVVNVGGTSGVGNGKGHLFGSNQYCRLQSGATFWSTCVGQETDVSVRTGASVDIVVGQQVVMDSQFVVAPNRYAAAYAAANQSGAIGFDILLSDGGYTGFPSLNSTGTVFKCFPHNNSGNCGTIGTGFDLTNYGTITNNAFISTGFAVSGTGVITNTAIATDATHTDATVCEDTTSHTYFFGSGAAGICLGTSSIRFKHDVVSLDKGLNEIMEMRPVEYKLNADKGDPDKPLYGFIAEDNVKILPKLVGRDGEGNISSFDYMGVVPVLVNAIKEQQKQIDELRAKVYGRIKYAKSKQVIAYDHH
jgi:hypothetical protein